MTADKNSTGLKRVPVYLVFGEEEYFVSTKARRIVEELCPPDQQTFGLEVIDGRCDLVADAVTACRKCVAALRTVGFLGGGKVVWLRDATFLGETVIGKSDEVKQRVDELVAEIKAGWPAGQHLVVSADKASKRFALYKACKEAGEVFEYARAERDFEAERNAGDVVRKALTKNGLRMDNDALACFLERTGTDVRQIVNEVEKLSLYLGERREATRQDVDDIVSPSREAVLWSLADAVADRNLPSSLKTLRHLFYQKETAIGMIVILENRFRLLSILRACLDRGLLRLRPGQRGQDAEWSESPELDEVFGGMEKDDPRKMHPYRTMLMAKQAARFTQDELERVRDRIIAVHEQIVSSSVAPELLMQVLIAEVTAPTACSSAP